MDYADNVHGSNGLGGVNIQESTQKAISDFSMKTIVSMISECSEKVIWANTGSLTNLCILLRDFPEIKEKLEKIVIMGGAVGQGNRTPAA